jgi:hypothetical protein
VKSSGLGDALWVGGYDVSGDIQALSQISGGPKALDMTGINASAYQRIGGESDGSIDMTTFFNKQGVHVPLSLLPRTDQLVTYCRGTAIGSPAACLNSKQIGYDPKRATSGELTLTSQAVGNAYGLEWGVLLTTGTDGLRTDTTATNGASFDAANGLTTPAVPASTTPVTNTGFIPVTVVISGGTVTTVLINGTSAGSGDGTYTLPAGGTIAVTYSAAPTWTWTPTTAFGAQAYLQVTAFTGTDVTVTLQDSADNSSWANIASGAFAQTTAAITTQRLALTNTATVRRYLRAITTTVGGFTSVTFGVMFNRNPIAGVSF